jgi:hypothetical protein
MTKAIIAMACFSALVDSAPPDARIVVNVGEYQAAYTETWGGSFQSDTDRYVNISGSFDPSTDISDDEVGIAVYVRVPLSEARRRVDITEGFIEIDGSWGTTPCGGRIINGWIDLTGDAIGARFAVQLWKYNRYHMTFGRKDEGPPDLPVRTNGEVVEVMIKNVVVEYDPELPGDFEGRFLQRIPELREWQRDLRKYQRPD